MSRHNYQTCGDGPGQRALWVNTLNEEKEMLLFSSKRWLVGLSALAAVAAGAATLPDPRVDAAAVPAPPMQTAVFAGGCFWGVEAVFEHVKGVSNVVSGYAGGTPETAKYNQVSMGTTDHAESVRITYDPKQVSYGQLLKVFFAVAHDPTELNRQGPDVGPHYRSAIFVGSDEEKRVADAYIAQLNAARVFRKPIVTQVVPAKKFYEAELYHQDYLARHPDDPYIVENDLPKLADLKKTLPKLYVHK